MDLFVDTTPCWIYGVSFFLLPLFSLLPSLSYWIQLTNLDFILPHFFFLQDAYYTEYINIDIPVRKNITPSTQTYDEMKGKIIFIRSVFLTAYHTVSFLSLVSSKLRTYYK